MGKKEENSGPTSDKNNVPEKSQNKSPTGEAEKKNGFPIEGPMALQLLVALACLGAVTSWTAQYYNANYVIPPRQEKTFNIIAEFLEYKNKPLLRSVPNKHSMLDIFSVNTSKSMYNFQIFNDDKLVTKEDLTSYEYWCSETHVQGKITFSYNHLTTGITYFIEPDFSLKVLIESSGRNEYGNANSYSLVVSSAKKEDLKLNLTDGSRLYYFLSDKETETIEDTTDIDEKIKTETEKVDKTFDDVFQLKARRMPGPYTQLAQSALTFAANCFAVKQTTNFRGGIDSNFTQDTPFFFVESSHVPLKSLDEQIFPLMVVSKINTRDPHMVVLSWLQTVNERNQIGNRITNGLIELAPIQMPMFFQYLKESPDNKLVAFEDHIEHIELIAEQTWINSVGPGKLTGARWLGHSRGLFQLEAATPKGESSLELLCLLENMCGVMEKLFKKSNSSEHQKWLTRIQDTRTAIDTYYNQTEGAYADPAHGVHKSARASYAPVITGVLDPKDEKLPIVLEKLNNDPLYSPMGLQLSEEHGAPVSTNYLLLQSLRKYKALAGSGQERAHQMYSVLKNNLIAGIARANRAEKSFYGRFDKEMKPLGAKGHLDGTLVLLVMSGDV